VKKAPRHSADTTDITPLDGPTISARPGEPVFDSSQAMTPSKLPDSTTPDKPSMPDMRPLTARDKRGREHVTKSRLTHRAIIDNASTLSARFNLLKRQQIEKAHEVYLGVRPFTLSDSKGYGSLAILHAVTAKRPRINTQTDEATRAARTYEPGEAYWVDKLPHRGPDHDGNATGFIFFDCATSYTNLHLSAHGDAMAYTEALDFVQAETKLLRPGTIVKYIFGDVDRAWGTDKIGRRTNTIISEYLSKNPHLSIIPGPPHSPENNGAEACLSRVVVYYMANHVRGQIGMKGWGDMLRNAAFCFSHQTQPNSRTEEARRATP
jgi:hypothetical protein